MSLLKANLSSMKDWKVFIRWDLFLGALYLATLISPTFAAITRISIGTYAIFFALYLMWFISAILYYKKQGKKLLVDKGRFPEMVSLLLWLLVCIIYTVIGFGENGYWGIIYTVMFMTVYMMDYIYSTYNDRSALKVLIVIAFAIIAFDSLRSCFILNSEPFAARVKNALYTTQYNRFFRLELLGLGDYPLFTASAIGMPLLFYYTIKARHKIIMGIIYALSIIGIFYSGYTGSTLLIYLMLILFTVYALFFYKNKIHRRSMLILVAVTIVIIAMFMTFIGHEAVRTEYYIKYLDLWRVVTGQTDLGFTIEPKLNGHEEDFATIGYRTVSRIRFYNVSLESFIDNPIFGVGAYYKTATLANGIGNHSSWLDFLAMYGIVGCAPLILCFIMLFFRNLKGIFYSDTKFIRVVLWIFFMGYGLVNPVFVARVFPAVFCLVVAGDVRLGDNTLEFSKWIKSKKR